MSGTLVGRWIGPTGLMRIEGLEGQKVRGIWRGSKGGDAGFYGYIRNKGKEIKAMWYDDDRNITEGDRAFITLTLEDGGKALSVKADARRPKGSTDAPVRIEWTATRESLQLERDGGKFAAFTCKDKDIFDRLTSQFPHKDEAYRETQRSNVLTMTIRDPQTQPLHYVDGALTYIPPLCVSEPFFDQSARYGRPALLQDPPRNRGKQVLASVPIFGRPQTVGNPLPHSWEADPFVDWTTVVRQMRKERRQRGDQIGNAKMKERPAFRASTPGPGMTRYDQETHVYMSARGDGEDLEKLAQTARQALWDSSTGRPAGAESPYGVTRTAEGNLAIRHAPKNVLSGTAHWYTQAENAAMGGYPYASTPYSRLRDIAKEEREASTAAMKGRPAFKTANPIVELPKDQWDEPPPDSVAALMATGKLSPPQSPRRADLEKKSEKAPFRPLTREAVRDIPPLPEYLHVAPGQPLPDPKAPPSPRPTTAEGKGDSKPWRPTVVSPTHERLCTPVSTNRLNIHRYGHKLSGMAPLQSPTD